MNRDESETSPTIALDALESDNIAEFLDSIPLTSEVGLALEGESNSIISPSMPVKQGNQLIYWFFTWNNYPEDTFVETLETKFSTLCAAYVFQKEVGANGTPHIQGTIKLHKKMRWSEFNLPAEIHWEKTRDVKSAFAYCAKDDTRDGDTIWRFPKRTVRSTLKIITELKPWQQSIVDMCALDPDDRSINWIYDRDGNMGKTVLCKYMSTHGAIIATDGGAKDIACLLTILKKEGRDLNAKTTFIFNLARCGHPNYKAIESVKDGLMTSVKYESSTMIFNCPHVWVFSNNLPNMAMLSQDRWKMWCIHNDTLCEWDNEPRITVTYPTGYVVPNIISEFVPNIPQFDWP